MRVRDVIRLLHEDGLVLARQKGSHRQFKHPAKRGLVTVAGELATILLRVHSTAFSSKRV